MNITTRQISQADAFFSDFQALGLKSSIACFDFETSGLDPAEDRPIEAALIRITPDGQLTEFSTLIAYEKPLKPIITQLTGITNAMLKGAPHYESAMGTLYENMGLPTDGADCNSWLCGHNFIKFDMEFLRRFTMQRYKRPQDLKFWDTAGHYKAMGLKIEKAPKESFHDWHLRALNTRAKGFYFKLVQCCGEYGIPTAGAHRAMDDVRMTLQLFFKQALAYKAAAPVKPVNP